MFSLGAGRAAPGVVGWRSRCGAGRGGVGLRSIVLCEGTARRGAQQCERAGRGHQVCVGKKGLTEREVLVERPHALDNVMSIVSQRTCQLADDRRGTQLISARLDVGRGGGALQMWAGRGGAGLRSVCPLRRNRQARGATVRSSGARPSVCVVYKGLTSGTRSENLISRLITDSLLVHTWDLRFCICTRFDSEKAVCDFYVYGGDRREEHVVVVAEH